MRRWLAAKAVLAGLLLLPSDVFSAPGDQQRVEPPDLPFVVELPPGFGVELRPGLDSVTYTVHHDGEPYVHVILTAFPDFEVATDSQGRVRPAVQQEPVCKEVDFGPAGEPYRKILYLLKEAEELPDDVASQPQPWVGYNDFIVVYQGLNMPAAEQAVADRIVSSIFVPRMSGPLPLPQLRGCQ